MQGGGAILALSWQNSWENTAENIKKKSPEKISNSISIPICQGKKKRKAARLLRGRRDRQIWLS
jgi:hypothetical protein